MTIPRQDTDTQTALDNTTEDANVQLLVPLLANELFMYSIYKKYHWHVDGRDFYQYHLLFDKHADEHLPMADLIAERIRTIGGKAPGMPQDVETYKTVAEGTEPGSDSQIIVQNLCDLHEEAIRSLREAAAKIDENDDAVSNDIIVSDVLKLHELQLWFIRSCKD